MTSPGDKRFFPAKLNRPRSSRILLRDRLFKTLDGYSEQPVTWIAGPAGSGKTTLISSYIQERTLPCLWYQIDQGDSDIATFFYYMGLAGKKAAPRKRKPLPLLTPEYLLGISTFTRRFFEELFDRLKRPHAVVLDNYQDALPESPFHAVIKDALPAIPERIRVFVLSRGEPPPALARARASDAMSILGWGDLRLDLEETHRIVEALSGRAGYPDEMIHRIHEKTDGWVAGLLLLLRRADMEDVDPSAFERSVPEEVFDYFASEIFEKTDRETREFLLSTAMLPSMTVPMAERLSALPGAGDLLSSLNRRHFFTDRRWGQEVTYQYHPLFRDFLLAKSGSSYTPDRFRDLKGKAAGLLEEKGQTEDAFDLYRESGDIEGMVRLILGHAQEVLFQGRHLTLDQWLKALPPEAVGTDPWLLYWQGNALMPVNPGEARERFEQALALFQAREDEVEILLGYCGVFDAIAYGLRTFSRFDEWIPRLEAFCKGLASFPSPRIEAKVTLSMLHALALRHPSHPDFNDWEQRALSFIENEEQIDTVTRLYLGIILTFKRIICGELAEARLLARDLRALISSPRTAPLPVMTLGELEVFCCWLSGDFEACQKAASEGLELASATGVYLIFPLLTCQSTAGALSSGDLRHAARNLETLEGYLDRAGPWERGFYHLLKAWKALLEKMPAQAMLHSEVGKRFGEEAGCPGSTTHSWIIHALALHANGRHEESAALLSRALDLSRETNQGQVEFCCHLAQAEFALDSGKEARAIQSLRKAMSLGREKGYVNTWFWRPNVMARLCCKALEAGIEVDYVRDLVRKRGLVPEEPPLHLENWPWPLRIYTLGRFGVIMDGQPLKPGRKAQQKPIAMLKALIAAGGKGIGEDQLADALWPDADGDLARQACATTLHRLRKLLGDPEILPLREGRMTLDPRFCWVDARAFEGLLEEADACRKQGETERSLALTEKALLLYRGGFLAGEPEEPWLLSFSERLRGKFLKAVRFLARAREQAGQWEKAAEHYERCLEVDDCVEELYQRLMICFQRLGRRGEALSVYQRCKRTFDVILGVKPSAETEALRTSLLAE